ncbi:MAG: hypothetical protein ACRDHY_13970 [Anaerolineales bacterium]
MNFRKLDFQLESWTRPGDLILVQAAPSDVVGIARYLREDIPLASWAAGPRGTRKMPADLELLLAGRRRVELVKVGQFGAPAPPEAWLLARARLLRHELYPSFTEVMYFEPADGDVFFPRLSQRPGGTRFAR